MEENITIYISESNKGEEQIIINKQYKFNFSHSRKDNSRVYKCSEYKKIINCPEYISVKTVILRSINKKLPSNVTTFNEIPNESEYYKTERNEDFMIFKSSDLVIFQSPFQAKLFKKYNNDIFVDGTFYIAPKFSQQVFITRTYVKELNSFYTTSYAILRNKKQKTFKILFNKLIQILIIIL
ncbi:hypothetical protein LY90DRAFT_512538 [Neocallimastix californiae]|uniref:FLYWCH-type domain-containing protein n=1 Tax=Neocallimastix californiae TaxID=1754190 RepID=A0A1Y2BAJ7_9FUNG|nr:hypothetical protein LY90DRAFT_512538 [Neocallimastix californiae]|eukprot:ORY31105.1 hypothetical protein LY90DRAFT_512538 [Neocallimastix californiae]